MSGRSLAESQAATEFSAAPFDSVADLCRDPVGADLVALFAGNQYMVLPELFELFKASRPHVESIFYETLPPGIVIAQLRSGRLRMDRLELSVVPDIIAASPAALASLKTDGLVSAPVSYANNDLTLLVPAGNPAAVKGLADLARPGVRVAMPDPRTEGIGALALSALADLDSDLPSRVIGPKVASGEVRMTSIHHRQSPLWLRDGLVDVAVMWRTEGSYHLAAGAPFEVVEIDEHENRTGGYAVALCTGAAHPLVAAEFVEFLAGADGQAVFERHGFTTPSGQKSATATKGFRGTPKMRGLLS